MLSLKYLPVVDGATGIPLGGAAGVGYDDDGGRPTAGVYVDVTGIGPRGAAGGGCNEGNGGLPTAGVSADVPAKGSSSMSTTKKLADARGTPDVAIAGGGGTPDAASAADFSSFCVQNRTMNIERACEKVNF